jgi:hypothetical protein
MTRPGSAWGRAGAAAARVVALTGVWRGAAQAQAAPPLFEIPDGVETRWASPENPTGAAARAGGGRKGSPTIVVKDGASVVLAEARGTSGTVRRIRMTFGDRSARMLRGLRLDMYWDGAATPAVSAPVGDFFGVGLGRTAAFESALFSNPEGRSFNPTRRPITRTGRRLIRAGEGNVELDSSRDGKFERSDDWSSCAYFYLDRPESGLPPLAPVRQRVAGL